VRKERGKGTGHSNQKRQSQQKRKGREHERKKRVIGTRRAVGGSIAALNFSGSKGEERRLHIKPETTLGTKKGEDHHNRAIEKGTRSRSGKEKRKKKMRGGEDFFSNQERRGTGPKSHRELAASIAQNLICKKKRKQMITLRCGKTKGANPFRDGGREYLVRGK